MSNDRHEFIELRPGEKAAILFIHGFIGSPTETFGSFPDYLRQDRRLDDWGVFAMGYDTRLLPDFGGIWSSNASITTLAERLETIASARLAGRTLALVAHSMGGLIVQRALLDDEPLRARVSHVFLFGTPSAGLAKASPLRFWKRQLAEMTKDGPFIRDLRGRWTSSFSPRPEFAFTAVAGESDEFVPVTSSLDPFSEDQRAVVPGNHVEMVKPDGPGHESVALVAEGLLGTKQPWSQWASAWIASERGEFQNVIRTLWPSRGSLDQRSAVSLALALDSVGRRDDAIVVIRNRGRNETDAMGVLAGRLKRQWWSDGIAAHGERALALYSDALALSIQAGNPRQEYYHGINVAFMTLALRDDLPAAQRAARQALAACARAPEDYWRTATEGEAGLILGDDDAAIDGYRRALNLGPGPREIESMYTQALRIATGLLNRPRTAARLDEVFGRRPAA